MASTAAKPARVVVPHVLPFHKRCAVTLLYSFFRLFMATWRTKWVPATEEARDASQVVAPVILCVWHNRLAMAVPSYNKRSRTLFPGNGMAAVVSASRDGAFLVS